MWNESVWQVEPLTSMYEPYPYTEHASQQSSDQNSGWEETLKKKLNIF